MSIRALTIAAALLTVFGAVMPIAPAAPVRAAAVLRYLSPPDGAEFVSPGTAIALRLDGRISPLTLSPDVFVVVGSASGRHAGQVRLSDDGETIIFKPGEPFTPGERVTISVARGLDTLAGNPFPGLEVAFTISDGGGDLRLARLAAENGDRLAGDVDLVQPPVAAPAGFNPHPQGYATFPDDFPAYTVTVPASGTAPGLLFMAIIPWINQRPAHYLFIADDTGEPVYYQSTGASSSFDFKLQPNGRLSYYSSSNSKFHVLDNTYTEVEAIGAGNGYTADLHELQLLPNGHALLMIYDSHVQDMSAITPGGYTTATVIGLVVQELDLNRDVVFEWTSWDHYLITDTTVALDAPVIDLVHGNAIQQDTDGNLLISARHMDEITKIDRNTGDIIWRWGGKHNQFTFINDPDGPFYHQHDIRRLANGHVTLFDNHNSSPGVFSRAAEYLLDEEAITKTATLVWQYRNTPNDYASAMGNVQRLPDGHTLIGWGAGIPNVTEVLTDGAKLFEMKFVSTHRSYRAFRSPWSAVPAWAPALVVITDTVTPTLHYSWNGATDVAAYRILGGRGAGTFVLVGTHPRTGFEDQTELTGPYAAYCAFRIQPVNAAGQALTLSNVARSEAGCAGTTFFLPALLGP
ncbi:MAG: aryl-sulfate sulfotransferase [Anaerolineales bacterium]